MAPRKPGPEVVNTVEGDVGGYVVQSGVIQGDVVFNAAPNDDVRMVLRHEHRQIELGPGDDARVLLTVSSRSEQSRRLVFDLEGALGLTWRLVSDDYDAQTGPGGGVRRASCVAVARGELLRDGADGRCRVADSRRLS